MSEFEDDDSVHSGTSVPSIGEDAADPQVRHLIVSEDCCRAIYRSSGGDQYICPRITQDCQKRNHVRMRATQGGDAAIYEIHRGVRGGFRGVRSDRRLSPEEHLLLIDEARERNRASAALTVGASTLTEGPDPTPSPNIDPPVEDDARPEASTTTSPSVSAEALPSAQPSTASLLAMIGQLQEQLRLQSAPTSEALPSTVYTAEIPTAVAPPISPSIVPSPALVIDQAPVPPTPSVSFASTPPTPPRSVPRWYAIVVGKVPSDTGVYSDFSQVGPKVTGVSGAVFRGNFKTKEEAQSYLSGVASIPAVSTPTRKQKWYVVSVGQDPSDRGVYDNWPEVASKVVGVSGAVYQGGFRSQPKAEDFLARTMMPAAASTATSPHRDPNPAVPPPSQGPPRYPYYQGHQQSPSAQGRPPTPGPPGGGTYPGQPSIPGYPPPGPHCYSADPPDPNYHHGGGPSGLDPHARGPGPYGQYQHPGPYSQAGAPSSYGPAPVGTPSPYGAPFPREGPAQQGMYGQAPGGPYTGSGFHGGPSPSPGGAHGSPGSQWAVPGRLVGPDPSTGTKGELWGVKAGEDFSMLQAWSPPGMGLEKQVRFGDQSLDAVGLPGPSPPPVPEGWTCLPTLTYQPGLPGRFPTCVGCCKGRGLSAGFQCLFSKAGFVLNNVSYPPCNVSYHASCVGVGPPFRSRYRDLTRGLLFPKTLAGYPFICELCTVRANVGPTPLPSAVMNALMMLEWMRLIDAAHSWAPKTLAG
jgi:hypothetical protein